MSKLSNCNTASDNYVNIKKKEFKTYYSKRIK